MGDPRQDPRRQVVDPRAAMAAPDSVPPPPPPPPQPILFPPPPPPPSLLQNQQQQQQGILFGGDDAMDEEDEDVDMIDSRHHQHQHHQQHSMAPSTTTATTMMSDTTTTTAAAIDPIPLPTRILTPSPYPHHTRGATSARFRNALSRVTTHPTSDSEAWAALLTEIQTCWRQQLQPILHLPSVETQAQLDFVVSCYGALLYHFPYALQYVVALGEILLQASARPGEPGGPKSMTSAIDVQRGVICEGQLETLFRSLLNAQSGVGFGMLHKETASSTAEANKQHKVTTSTTSNHQDAEQDDEKIKALSFLQGPTQDPANASSLIPENPPSHTTTTATTDTMQQQQQQQQQQQHKEDEELTKVVGGMGTWSVPLWMLYLKKVQRDLQRHARTMPPKDPSTTNITKWLRDKMVASYELAIEHVGFGYNNHMLWNDYLTFVKSWTASSNSLEDLDPLVQQQQMIQLRSVYQRLVQLPMTGLDGLWQDYEAFERSHSEELATALLADYTPKYQHARTVYLERARVYNYTGDLQLGRLATPPVTRQKNASGSSDSKITTGGLRGGADGTGTAGGGMSGMGTTGVGGGTDDAGVGTKETLEDYLSNLQEEYQLLQAWKKRVSYERTNPERLLPHELPRRMRHAHLEMISVLTRHPEVWHMWSMYEYYHAHKPVRAMAILQLGLQHIPDCTLLAHTQAQLVEQYCSSSQPSLALKVLERFLQTSPNTLAFCVYQQMVRRYQGLQAARAVFAKARRVLTGELDGTKETSGAKDGDETKDDRADEGDDGNDAANGKRWMVTNRLDPSVGRRRRRSSLEGLKADPLDPSSGTVEHGNETPGPKVAAGPITWHLYVSHATMEHRLNHFPEIAARIYELGLRNHPHFLTQPPFVLRYAQLLLELNDTVNLRALLTRAVSAVTDDDGTAPSSGPKAQVAAVLWDMTLQFETILSGADPLASQLIQDVERKRHMAIMGPDVEDVATGGYLLDTTTTTTIGAQKTTIAEQLIRNDGYDISSIMVNGMARSVSVLEVMGLWGSNVMSSGVTIKRSQPNRSALDFLEEEDNVSERSGGASDASYQRRLLYQRLYESGVLQGGGGFGGADVGAGASGVAAAGNKILSARERMATAAGGGGATSAAVNVAIQQQPEWIRPLLLLLPASKLRLAALTKPPPHLTEMALLQLRQCTLPSERPQDDNGGMTASQQNSRMAGQKRPVNGGGGDSSDEDDNMGSGGGYGMQFRSRQRSRQLMAGGDTGTADLGANQ